MATDSTNNSAPTKQKRIFVTLLLTLWLLVITTLLLQYFIFKSQDWLLPAITLVTITTAAIGYIASHLYMRLEQHVREREHEHVLKLRNERERIRIKKQLTNNINHELKTPICSILGYLEMIVNNPDISAEKSREFVNKSYNQAERLRLLMSDLSTITRMDEASNMIELRPLDLETLITNIIEDVSPQARRQYIKVLTDLRGPLPIMGNELLLYSIFRNLIDNAIEYSGGRHIWVQLLSCEEHDGDENLYHFSIRDNGIGVEPSHLPYLFERFYRVDGGRSRKLGGTGLGLSIVKNAVVFHGGTISAHLWKMGGLDFRFTLRKHSDEI